MTKTPDRYVLCRLIRDGSNLVWRAMRPSGSDIPYMFSSVEDANAARSLWNDGRATNSDFCVFPAGDDVELFISTIFRDHNCSRCQNGKLPCVSAHPRQCGHLIAKNH